MIPLIKKKKEANPMDLCGSVSTARNVVTTADPDMGTTIFIIVLKVKYKKTIQLSKKLTLRL